MHTQGDRLITLTQDIREFAQVRDWEQFHNPKDLAAAISIEAAELQQLFLWVTTEESKDIAIKKIDALKEEIGDVLIFLLRLCDILKIDPIKVGQQKLKTNEKKYPVHRSRGTSKKYNEL